MRILLADDQPEVRSALRLLLENEPGLQVVAEDTERERLLTQVELTCHDLVLLDWELPGLNASFLPHLRLRFPSVMVIALSCDFSITDWNVSFNSRISPARPIMRVSTPSTPRWRE